MYNHHLDTFLCAADLGSFSRAAEELYVSPNAVMKQINLLESHLELQLFIRDNHGLRLTPAGEVVYREAKAIIRRSNNALAQARAAAAPKSLIRVGTSLMRPGQRVIELWQEVHDQCPDIQLQLVSFDDRTKEYSEVVRRMGRDIDIFFGLVPSDRFRSSCNILQLGSYPVCCAMPRSHPLAQRQSLTVQDLHGEQLMMVYRGNSAYISMLCGTICCKTIPRWRSSTPPIMIWTCCTSVRPAAA